jgi:hypothetical protein
MGRTICIRGWGRRLSSENGAHPGMGQAGDKSPRHSSTGTGGETQASELRANHGQPAPYPSLAVRARNGRVADNTPTIGHRWLLLRSQCAHGIDGCCAARRYPGRQQGQQQHEHGHCAEGKRVEGVYFEQKASQKASGCDCNGQACLVTP